MGVPLGSSSWGPSSIRPSSWSGRGSTARASQPWRTSRPSWGRRTLAGAVEQPVRVDLGDGHRGAAGTALAFLVCRTNLPGADSTGRPCSCRTSSRPSSAPWPGSRWWVRRSREPDVDGGHGGVRAAVPHLRGPGHHPRPGALQLSLAYLTVLASLERMDPALEEAARSSGRRHSRWSGM